MTSKKPDEVQELFISSEREATSFRTKSRMRRIALNFTMLISEAI